jgi:hypothetical protein
MLGPPKTFLFCGGAAAAKWPSPPLPPPAVIFAFSASRWEEEDKAAINPAIHKKSLCSKTPANQPTNEWKNPFGGDRCELLGLLGPKSGGKLVGIWEEKKEVMRGTFIFGTFIFLQNVLRSFEGTAFLAVFDLELPLGILSKCVLFKFKLGFTSQQTTGSSFSGTGDFRDSFQGKVHRISRQIPPSPTVFSFIRE